MCVQGATVSTQMTDSAGLAQTLQIELAGSEAAHGRGVDTCATPHLLQHGDTVCLRATNGKLLQLLPPMLHDQTLLQVTAAAADHSGAQLWEVLLA